YYAEAFSEIPIKTTPQGATIKLRDVATARDRFEETPTATYFNNRLSVKVSITSTNSEDLIGSADIVKEYITAFNERYDNIQIVIERDFSITLNQRTQLLFENALIGMALVILFLSLFLNIRLAFWVAFGLPVAFLGMFVFAPGFDITINVISLFGMIVVIGILVDDGIVIAENIYQQYEKGKSPIDAAIDGTMEVLPPILSAITTTCLAFAIFLFLDSRIGEFYGELATLVILTLVVSLVEALIILPAHLAHSKALQPKEKRKKQGVFFTFMRGLNHHSERLMFYVRDTFYLPVLRFSIKYKVLAFSIFILFFAITLGSIMGGKIKVSLFPSIASDRVQVNLVMPQGTNERITDSIISMIEDKAVLANEELTKKYLTGEEYKDMVLFESIIKEMVNASSANLIINMLPGESRPDEARADIVSNYLKELVGPVIGVERLIFNSGGNFGGSPVSVSLLSNDLEALKGAKDMLKQRLSENPALINIADNNPEGIKEIRINLKPSAYALGYTLQSIINQVRSGFFGLQAQRFQRGQDEIRVWVRYDEPTRQSLENLDDMRIISPQGQRVPLREIVDYEIIRGDVNINHLDGRREIQVTADLKNPNDSSIEMMDDEMRKTNVARVRPTAAPGMGRDSSRVRCAYPGYVAAAISHPRHAGL
ncbi:MAG: efflux RND transporter permease subunit, partial [Flavobacteriaceae bacterium]|nr:efflux RND transporter permease subunit [Flavobacteriaceae bacterium]